MRSLVVALAAALLLAPAVAQEGDGAPAPTTRAVPAYRQADKIGVVTIQGAIDNVSFWSIERRIQRAREEGCSAIVLDIDTPGGAANAALDICALLKDQQVTPANTVAWIHPDAYSAGTIIALACNEIVIAPNATFGDAAPIQVAASMLVEMAPAERAKIEAPLLAEVIDSARRNHYDENLVQSFISVGVELWLIEHKTTGERIFVDRNEYEVVFGDAPPEEITSVTPADAPTVATPKFGSGLGNIPPPWAPSQNTPPDDRSLEEIEEEAAAIVQQQQELPPSRDALDESARGDWNLIAQVVPDDRLLVVKRDEAVAFGLARAVIANDTELKEYFGARELARYDANWSEGLVRFLISPGVRIVLIMVLLIGGFIEMAAPGTSIFGAAAAVALLLLIGAPTLVGLAQWWDILLIGLGMLLVAAEIFVIPGTGVAGFGGAACLLIGIVGTFVSGDLSTEAARDQMWTGVLVTVTALFGGVAGIWVASRYVHTLPIMSRLVLREEVGARSKPTGVLAAMTAQQAAGPAPGDVGIARTDLRPAGRAEFEGRLVDVQSPGDWIESGQRVRITRVSGYVIEVEAEIA